MAEDLLITRPSIKMESDILEYRQEYLDFGETSINGSCGLSHYECFDEWLELTLSIENERLKNNYHASTFFSVRKSDNRIIGSIQLRHYLTPDLEQHGGHIGYGIRPPERRKGYGRQQLLLVLDVARSMRIPKVMITCDKDNVPSGKTALSCSGVLAYENVFNGKEQQIYWINLC